MTRGKRLAKSLGLPELARRLGVSQKKAAKALARPSKATAEKLAGIEKRHLAAKKARKAQRKPPTPKYAPQKRRARGAVVRQGKDHRDAIRETLELMKNAHVGSKIKTHVYPSGQVRGEIRIPLPKRRSVHDMLLDIAEEAMFKPGTWTSTGFLGTQTKQQKDRSPMRRYKGKSYVHTSPQKDKAQGEQIITANQVWEHMKAADYAKPDEIILRVAWNPSGKQESFRRPKRKHCPVCHFVEGSHKWNCPRRKR